MKNKFLILGLILATTLFSSCNKSSVDPASKGQATETNKADLTGSQNVGTFGTSGGFNKHFRRDQSGTVLKLTCDGEGTTCKMTPNGMEILDKPTRELMSAIQNKTIPAFFTNGDWAALLPELRGTSILAQLQKGTLTMYQMKQPNGYPIFVAATPGIKPNNITDNQIVFAFGLE